MSSSTFQRRMSAEPAVVVRNEGGRRMVSRTNPEISYAYGAPAAAGNSSTRARKRRSTQEREMNIGEESENGMDDNAEASTSFKPEAAERYAALKKRKLQEAEQARSTETARRSPRKSGVDRKAEPPISSASAIASRKGNTSSAGGGGVGSDELSSETRRQRMMSPGRSRSLFHGQLNSFYMDRDADSEDNVDMNGGEDNVPSSILLGAQRQGHDMINAYRNGPELDSIHSSDIHDSRSRDYAELQREADLLEDVGTSENAKRHTNGGQGRKTDRAIHARMSGLNGIIEESDAEQSAEERKHSQKTETPSEAKKTFRSPQRPSVRKMPIPIARHSGRRIPRIPISLLAVLGICIAVFIGANQGWMPDLMSLSPIPSDGTLGDAALRKRVQLLEKRLGAAEKQVLDFEKRMTTAKTLAESVTEVAKKLPAELAIHRDKQTGQFKLDASTLQELKQVFVQKGDESTPQPSWKAFFKANEAALRKLTSSIVGEEASSGTFVTRSAFLDMLMKELDELKSSMEFRFNANAQEMQNDILAKIRAQQDMFEKAGSWTKGQDGKGGKLPSLDGSDKAQLLMKTMIDDALELYSSDRLGERDFALYSAGGRVIPSLTSPTYGLRPRSMSWLAWASGSVPKLERVGVEGQPPVIALVPDNTPGMCWAFAGSEGQLGISLARRVIVSSITFEHTSASISHESGASAPRDVTVWAIVERPEDVKRLSGYRQERQKRGSDADTVDEDQLSSPSPIPPSERHMLLSSFTYDVFASRALQSFPVSHEAETLQIPVAVVQVQIHSNHGKSEYTCVYRVRVHGREWTLDDEAST